MKKLFTLLSLLFILSCSEKNEPIDEQQTEPTTFIKTENEIVSVNANTIVLSGNQNEIEVSDIIVSAANDNAPRGFLRKVVSKTEANGNIILQTQQSTISDAVKHFYEEDEEHEDNFNFTFQPTDASGRVSQQQIIPITITLDESITTTQGGAPITVSITGDLTITPEISGDIKIKNRLGRPKFEKFELAISTNNNLNVSINTELSAEFDTDDIQVGEFTGAPINLFIGIPIVIVPQFKLFVGANGNLDANILYSYTNNSIAKAGINYEEGWQFLPDNGITIDSQSAEATASVSGNLKAYVKPQFSLSLYDESFVSGGIGVAPYARFQGQVNSTSYNYAILGGVDTNAFFTASLFGFADLVDEEWNNLIDVPEWEIASGSANLATITNLQPVDGATIENQPIEFSWQINDFTEPVNYEILLGTDINNLNPIGTTNNPNFTYDQVLQNNTYFWKVIARNTSNETITEGLIFDFIINETADASPANTPIPNMGATEVTLNGNLSFTEGANTPTDATFKIYFDTNANPTTEMDLGSDTSYTYSNLQEGTLYYWRVETISVTGEVLVTSPIWNFTTLTNAANTQPVNNPIPADNTNNVELNGDLSFTAGENTPTDATYRLYFDTNPTPTTQINLGSQTSYMYSNLQENTTYYWFVETIDNTGSLLATSSVWDFTSGNTSASNVFEGDADLFGQAEVDDFSSNNYTVITGYLRIGAPNGVDINLNGLNTLTEVQDYLQINNCKDCSSLQGLNNLTSIGALFISRLENLSNFEGLNGLTNIDNDLVIGGASINENLNLLNLNGLDNLVYVGGNVNIWNNPQLQNINGLSNLQSVNGEYLRVRANVSLSNLCGLTNIVANGGITGLYQIYENLYNPTQQDIIDGNCSQNSTAETVTDIDGNVYESVQIGTQLWLKSNLKVTRYSDGTEIPNVVSDSDWLDLEDNNTDRAYAWYNNDIANKDIYGALYTYAAVVNGDNSGNNVQGICPEGWHVPSSAEKNVLEDFVENDSGRLKQEGFEFWQAPNVGADNSSGFTSLPGGVRSFTQGTFSEIGTVASYHTSSEISTGGSINFSQSTNSDNTIGGTAGKSTGRSCRCIKD